MKSRVQPKARQATVAAPPRHDEIRSTGLNEWGGLSSKGLSWKIHLGETIDVCSRLEQNSIDCIVTSPPYYWQRDYDAVGQIGLEPTIDGYVTALVQRIEALRAPLKSTGTLFLNLGDTYYSAKGKPKGNDAKSKARRFGLRAVDQSGLGVPRKTTIGIPWRVALALIDKGWVLRSSIIWHRKAAMPEPTAHDRPWRTYEFVFMFSKNPKYFFNRSELNGAEDVWTVSDRAKGSAGVHYAAFPLQLADKCIRVGCPEGGVVLDPFAGTGTTLEAASKLGRSSIGIDIKREFCEYMVKRLNAL